MFPKSNKLMFLGTTLAILGLGMAVAEINAKLDLNGKNLVKEQLQQIFNKMNSLHSDLITINDIDENIQVSNTLLSSNVRVRAHVTIFNEDKIVAVIIKSSVLGDDEITIKMDGEQIGYLKVRHGVISEFVEPITRLASTLAGIVLGL